MKGFVDRDPVDEYEILGWSAPTYVEAAAAVSGRRDPGAASEVRGQITPWSRGGNPFNVGRLNLEQSRLGVFHRLLSFHSYAL
jgi:hypothetical protein